MKSFRYLLLLIAAISLPAHAYELATHGRLTHEAYKRSVLKTDSELLKDLGIKDITTFGTGYYDVSGDQIEQREKHDFEQSARRMPEEVDPLSLPGWLLRGAIREDDWTGIDISGCQMIAENPQDDPYSNPPDRPKNHFYDPYYDRALTFLGVTLGEAAPNWAVGTDDAFAEPPAPNSNRRNHFTVFDAREAMYRALTGKGRNATDDEFDVAPTKAERDKYWATLFRALGDIVHLIQDMGQPQHTRNDRHSGACIEAITGHASVYEKYLDCRATGGQFEYIDNYQDYYIDSCYPLTYDGYTIPRFTDYLSYFTTRHKDADISARQGLADYSNRGFFSAGTNIESENNVYALPDRNPAAYIPTNLYVDWQGESLGSNPDAMVTILQGSVPDSLPGGQTVTNIPLTTYGAWDQFLRPKGKADYSLNRYNYDAMANLLIPRAVAYSAGFIDYFFRGRIEAEGSPGTTMRSLA